MIPDEKPAAPVVVVGAGAAGLAAALRLCEAGAGVVVLEGSRAPGGRARSFTHAAWGRELDWGPHLLMAANPSFRSLLERVGGGADLAFRPSLELNYRRREGESLERARLAFPARGGLLAQLPGVLGWRGPRLSAKAGLLAGLSKIISRRAEAVPGESVREMLARLGQGEDAVRWFWRPFARGVLNMPTSQGSAALLEAVIRQTFADGPGGAALGVPQKPLGALWARRAVARIEELGGRVRLGRPALGLEVAEGKVSGVVARGPEVLSASCVISAVPPDALARLAGESLAALFPHLARLRPSPIASAYCRLARAEPGPHLEILLDEEWEWLFRVQDGQGDLVCLLAGAADSVAARPRPEMEASARACLGRIFPKNEAREVLVVRERAATWANGAAEQAGRMETAGPIDGLFLAGDWTRTGLPATIEGAVRSGEKAAEAALSRLGMGG